MSIEIRPVSAEHLTEFLSTISVAFGIAQSADRVERARVPELELRLGAFEGGEQVGSAGAFKFGMTVPGGAEVETSGVSVVSVLPTHRRRGILRTLMRRLLDEAHARGQPVAALFSSEGPIYGRFGYGMASLAVDVDLERHRSAFIGPDSPVGQVRLVSEAHAADVFPQIWDSARQDRPGMLARSEGWWRQRRLRDPDGLRGGRGPLQRALLTLDGPAAYALYRFEAPFAGHPTSLEVTEAIASSPAATRALWRYLCDIDLIANIKASLLPADHPLLLLLADPRALRMQAADGLWVRLVDVAAALSARRYGGDGSLVLEVEDSFCPWNAGRYRFEGGVARRSDEPADLTLGVDALGAVYLGAFSFAQLAAAGRIIERQQGALGRADALFLRESAPWCPEIF